MLPKQPPRRRYCLFAVFSILVSSCTMAMLLILPKAGDAVLSPAQLKTYAAVSLGLALTAILMTFIDPALRGRRLAYVAGAMSLLVFFLAPVAGRINTPEHMMECATRLKELDVALMAYLETHDGQLPDASRWQELLKPYVKDPSVFRCPLGHTGPYSYAMNSAIDPNLAANPSDLVLIFECKPGSPQCGGKELLDPRHSGGCNVLFPDLHIEGVCRHVIDTLRWTADSRPHE